MRPAGASSFPHLSTRGEAWMVDVSGKPETARTAVAEAWLRVRPATYAAVRNGKIQKGDAIAVARVAGILAAKRVPEWIPLAHPIPLSRCAIEISLAPPRRIRVVATASAIARTGVEMEAITAASVAALTLYDMLKGMERGITIERVRLLEKDGGRRGPFRRRIVRGSR